MQVFNTRSEISGFVREQKTLNKTIGFVPTMGALHAGHLSLVDQSAKSCDITIVSIFVNPTQFNDPKDLEKYPRDIEKDLKLLHECCDAVFIPSVKEIYPVPDNRIFDFDGIDQLMEGAHRPGHFNGVAQVVSTFFEIVNPHIAFFGEKDFQQVAIIRKMVENLGIPVVIETVPIMREADGLAMSSRNMLLEKQFRDTAGVIYETLTKSRENIHKLSLFKLKEQVLITINKTNLEVEYFDIVDEKTLKSISKFDEGKKAVGCIAVWAGNVRLIDNITYNL